MNLLNKYMQAIAGRLDSLRNLSLLFVRLLLGLEFLQTGWGKLHNLDKITEYFISLGIPLAKVQAPFVSCIEFIGGILLILGLGMRLVAVLLIGVMTVALATAVIPELKDKSEFISTVELSYIGILLILLTNGAGNFSLDHWLKKTISKRQSEQKH